MESEEQEILENLRDRIDYIIKSHKEYLDVLSEYDRTGVLKIHGKILYARKRDQLD